MKPKACKVCRAEFTPQRMGQKVCSPVCALALAKSQKAKAIRKDAIQQKRETKSRLESMKGIPDLIREADKAFMAYIRARDKAQGRACISSGRELDWTGNKVDAGHYRSRGAASHLRYDERNCHAQSKYDNRYLGGNIAEYRHGLIARIGLEEVVALEQDNEPRKWTRDELIQIKQTYKAKLKELQRVSD